MRRQNASVASLFLVNDWDNPWRLTAIRKITLWEKLIETSNVSMLSFSLTYITEWQTVAYSLESWPLRLMDGISPVGEGASSLFGGRSGGLATGTQTTRLGYNWLKGWSVCCWSARFLVWSLPNTSTSYVIIPHSRGYTLLEKKRTCLWVGKTNSVLESSKTHTINIERENYGARAKSNSSSIAQQPQLLTR